MYQLLKAIKYMHSANVLHRDLKPSNLLLNSDCFMKIADFGLARSIASLLTETDANPILTDYVATRWYRAPEILLGSTKYTKGVDVWSIGCILGELLGGKPLFPGTSTMNQLDRIIEITGRPSQEDIEAINSPFSSTMLESLPPSTAKPLSDLFPNASSQALDLLKLTLEFNPEKRITAEQALLHPYLAQFHNSSDEPVCEKEIKIAIDDDRKFSISDYRTHLYNDIVAKRKEKKRKKKEASAKDGKPRSHSTSSGKSKTKSKEKDGSKAKSSSSSSSSKSSSKSKTKEGSKTKEKSKEKEKAKDV